VGLGVGKGLGAREKLRFRSMEKMEGARAIVGA